MTKIRTDKKWVRAWVRSRTKRFKFKPQRLCMNLEYLRISWICL